MNSAIAAENYYHGTVIALSGCSLLSHCTAYSIILKRLKLFIICQCNYRKKDIRWGKSPVLFFSGRYNSSVRVDGHGLQ
jgi:hypothetical protein